MDRRNFGRAVAALAVAWPVARALAYEDQSQENLGPTTAQRWVDIEASVHRAVYKRQIRRLKGDLGQAKGKLGPEAVYTALRHALTSPRPKPHYVITTPARRGVLLKRLLPAGLFYKILARMG